MEVFPVVLLAAAVGVVIRVLTRYTGDASVVRRWALRAGAGSIGEASEGEPLRLVGIIGAVETFDAPFTGRRCVYLDIQIEAFTGGPDVWRVLVREVRSASFTVDDGTGKALVDPDGARIAIDRDAGLRSEPVDLSSPAAVDLLVRHGQMPGGVFAKRRMRYREAGLEVGERVAVVGVGVREPDPDAIRQVTGYRDGPPTRLRLGGSTRDPILITDAPAATRG